MGTGRKKIEIKKIEDKQSRAVTFSKRRPRLFKKAAELEEKDKKCKVSIIVFSKTGKLYTFGDPDTASEAFLKKGKAAITSSETNFIGSCYEKGSPSYGAPKNCDDDNDGTHIIHNAGSYGGDDRFGVASSYGGANNSAIIVAFPSTNNVLSSENNGCYEKAATPFCYGFSNPAVVENCDASNLTFCYGVSNPAAMENCDASNLSGCYGCGFEEGSSYVAAIVTGSDMAGCNGIEGASSSIVPMIHSSFDMSGSDQTHPCFQEGTFEFGSSTHDCCHINGFDGFLANDCCNGFENITSSSFYTPDALGCNGMHTGFTNGEFEGAKTPYDRCYIDGFDGLITNDCYDGLDLTTFYPSSYPNPSFFGTDLPAGCDGKYGDTNPCCLKPLNGSDNSLHTDWYGRSEGASSSAGSINQVFEL